MTLSVEARGLGSLAMDEDHLIAAVRYVALNPGLPVTRPYATRVERRSGRCVSRENANKRGNTGVSP
jgi:hypothetical protein